MQVRETSRFSLWKPRTWSQAGAAAPKGQEDIKKDFRCGLGVGVGCSVVPTLIHDPVGCRLCACILLHHTHPLPTSSTLAHGCSDVILPAGLHDNVRMMAAAAANTKRHGAPFRHMLFYGAR